MGLPHHFGLTALVDDLTVGELRKYGLQRISFILRSKKLLEFTGLMTATVSTSCSVLAIAIISSSTEDTSIVKVTAACEIP